MLYEVDWAPDGTYRPGEQFSPERFYDDCLKNSNEFDLQLGYFSSAAISVLADGFATFISNGGKMRLVINHILSQKDKDAVTKGISGELIDCFDLTNFEALRTTFDEYTQQFFDCFAFLIRSQRIEIQIIKPRGKSGISHYKSGQFRDGDSVTSFDGSANFTIGGLFNNLEHIKIERSDSIDLRVQKSIQNARKEFDDIMAGRKTNITYLSPEHLIAAVSSAYGDKDIEELLHVERKLREAKRERRRKAEEATWEYNNPHFPYPSGPREYQKQAFRNWVANKQKGLFAMATGAGKTITSLNCLLEIYKQKGYYKALILVPTATLVDQWEKECRKFSFIHIIKVYSKNPDWKSQLGLIQLSEMMENSEKPINYIIISTYASFTSKAKFDILNSLSRKQLLLIADEAHNIGSGSLIKKLKNIAYIRRIGLSATPERQFDDEGNKAIREFFGLQEGYTYEYSMEAAIRNGVLCRYFYYPHLVHLDEMEMDKYAELTGKIVKYFNFNTGTFERKDDILTALLIARKRIIHKAKEKQSIFRSIVQQRFNEKGNLKYTLVYVPEGNEVDYAETEKFLKSEVVAEDKVARHLIDEYTRIVCEVGPKVTVKEFVSDSGEREETLAKFSHGEIEVLTSMKCLDEGVDVPRSELAIFCASTGNPRQFIQRRGRVLRKHRDKEFAILHDLIVAPKIDSSDELSFRMERSLLRSELKRVCDFAGLSDNPTYAIFELKELTDYYHLSIFETQ